MNTKLQAGDQAPEFSLASTDGVQTLARHRGEWVVLYFYPKDSTPGCTTQACDLRDNLASLDAVVLGVSPDGIASHEAFIGEFGLNFPLLADEDHAVAEQYGAWGPKKVFGKDVVGIIRSSFIIDPQGKVAAALYGVDAKGHAGRIADLLTGLRESGVAAA